MEIEDYLKSLEEKVDNIIKTINKRKEIPKWKVSLEYYNNEEEGLAGVHCLTDEAFKEACRRIDEPELREMPYALVGDKTLIVPKRSLEYFRGIRYKQEEVAK